MNGISFNVNTTGIPNVCTAPWNLQHIKDLKMTEWSVETCTSIISSNKCCADMNNWLIVWYLYAEWGSWEALVTVRSVEMATLLQTGLNWPADHVSQAESIEVTKKYRSIKTNQYP